MKPRTKLQERVLALSKFMRGISQEEKKWAKAECLDHLAYANKTSAFCLDCGETFPLDIIHRKRATCPNCSTKLKVEGPKRKTTLKQRVYFAIAEVYSEFQVVRNFELISHHKKGYPADYEINEILQQWILSSGKFEYVGLLHHTQGYCDSWTGRWEIRQERAYYMNKYEIYPYKYHPESEFKPEYRMYGIDHKLSGMTLMEAVKVLPHNPKAETLLKSGQYNLFSQCFHYSGKISYWWPSIRICLRNRYKVRDASLWLDHMELLRYFRKDTLNVKYVCPKNLRKEHDKLIAKRQQLEKKRDLERQRMQVKKDNVEYTRTKAVFFGIGFSKGNISINVLKSVQEFMEEGDILKHCLFANKYHKRKDSLILSAKVDGERMETVEVCLNKFEILQSRGKHNNHSDYHKEITELVKANMELIMKAAHVEANETIQLNNYATAV